MKIVDEASKDKNYPEFSKLKELHQYAVLNYLAVLKILKKHDKHYFPAIREEVLEGFMQMPLYKAVNSPILFQSLKKSGSLPTGPDCPICLEPSITPVTLECGHQFCWTCLWNGDMENHVACPLCRKSQTLNPSEININDILGKFSKKYFPRSVEKKEPIPEGSRDSMTKANNESFLAVSNDMQKITNDMQDISLDVRTRESKIKIDYNPRKSRKPNHVGSLNELRYELHKDLCARTMLETSMVPVKQEVRSVRSMTWTAPSSPLMSTFSEQEDDDCIFDLEM